MVFVMRVMSRTLSLLTVFLVLCTMCFSIVSAEQESAFDDAISVRYQYIQSARCILSINDDTASIGSNVKGTYGSTTRCEIELKLQKKVLFWWSTVETWDKTALSYQTSLNVTYSVESGKTYRAVAVFSVWNGSNSETATITSASVEAP